MKTLQVRLPDDLREEAGAVLDAIGLDLPTAIRLFLKRVVHTRSIPFALEAPGVAVEKVEVVEVDPETQAAMDKVGRLWEQRRPSLP